MKGARRACCRRFPLARQRLPGTTYLPRRKTGLAANRKSPGRELEYLTLIQRAALKDWKAAAWLLERRHPDMFARPEVQLGQHVSVQVPSNEVISWLSKTLPSIENLARTATSDQEDLGQKPQS